MFFLISVFWVFLVFFVFMGFYVLGVFKEMVSVCFYLWGFGSGVFLKVFWKEGSFLGFFWGCCFVLDVVDFYFFYVVVFFFCSGLFVGFLDCFFYYVSFSSCNIGVVFSFVFCGFDFFFF